MTKREACLQAAMRSDGISHQEAEKRMKRTLCDMGFKPGFLDEELIPGTEEGYILQQMIVKHQMAHPTPEVNATMEALLKKQRQAN